MKYNPEKHRRRSIRLPGHDYSEKGIYFVTVCARDRACLFGDVAGGEMRLSPAGEIVRDEWARSAILRPRVTLDQFVIMPNHLHGIIVLGDHRDTSASNTGMSGKGTLQRAPTIEWFGRPTSDSIPTIIRLFKSTSTKRINLSRSTPAAPVWQRNYHEQIIRSEESLNRIRQYIAENPLRWEFDSENPAASTTST